MVDCLIRTPNFNLRGMTNDENRLDRYLIDLESDRDDYMTDSPAEMTSGFDPYCPDYIVEGRNYWWKIEPAFLGNASEPFDIESLGYVEFAPPEFSICKLFGESVDPLSFHV